jgi:hypothetical protein
MKSQPILRDTFKTRLKCPLHLYRKAHPKYSLASKKALDTEGVFDLKYVLNYCKSIEYHYDDKHFLVSILT